MTLVLSIDRNADRRFFDQTKPGDEFASKAANLNTIRQPDNRSTVDTRSHTSTSSNASRNRVPESPYNGTPRLSIKCNGFSATQELDARRKFLSADRKSPEMRLDSFAPPSPCRNQDVINSNGFHANGSATKSKCDDNFFSGRRWLDFQLFSNQLEASALHT